MLIQKDTFSPETLTTSENVFVFFFCYLYFMKCVGSMYPNFVLFPKPVLNFHKYLHDVFLAPTLGLDLLPLFAIHDVNYFLCRAC